MFIIIGVLAIVYNNPAKGYEFSIYSQTSIFVWIGLLFIILCGITITVTNISSRYWFIGLLLILWSNFIILSLFIMKDYSFIGAGADPGFHINTTKQIISSGFFNTQKNFYPLTHVFLAEIYHISGLNLIFLFKIIPAIFSTLIPLYIFISAKYLLKKKEAYIIATLASTPLIWGWYLNLTPQHIASLFFPLAFYIIIRGYKTSRIAWKILLIIIPVLYAPFHPVPSIVLLLLLIFIWINPKDLINNIKHNRSLLVKFKEINPVIITLFVVLTISWLSGFYVWETNIININTVLTEGGPTHYDSFSENIASAQEKGYNLLIYTFKVFGAVFIYILLAILAIPSLWRKNSKLLNLYIVILSLITFTGFLFLLNLSFGPTRMLSYIVIFAIFPLAYFISELLRKSRQNKKIKKIAPILLIILFFGVSILGFMSVYPSSYTLTVSDHSTQSTIDGSEWIIKSKDTDIPWSSWYYNLNRYAQFLNLEENRTDLTRYNNLMFSDHFGYDVNSTIGKSFKEDRYLIIQDSLKYIYTDIYPEQANDRLLKSDFDLLENDRNLYKIYTNKDYTIWYINSINTI